MTIIFMKHVELLMISLGLLFLSIICQFVAGMRLSYLIKESKQMETTDNKLLKQCKLKYMSYYQLNGKIKNTAVFVDKFIQKIKCIGINLQVLVHLSGQLMLFSILLIGIILCMRLSEGDFFLQVIPYYFLSILYLYLFFTVFEAMAISDRKEILKTEMEDYLENHLLTKLEAQKNALKEEKIEKEEKKMPCESDQAELESLLTELFA